jgi:RHS repeat-associated protein
MKTTIINTFRFPGQYYDEETGLHYNYFRDYQPMIGRYVEADPIGIKGGKNYLYGYVGNNPVNLADSLGLMSCNGRWEQVGWDRIFNMVCVCYWLCVPCDGPVIWGGNPRTLPRTFGTVTNSGDIESGNDCICRNRPGPEKDCKKCDK